MHRLSVCLLFSLALLFTACDSGSPDDGGEVVNPTTITGNWVGEIVSQDDTLGVAISMIQAVNEISGTGFVESDAFGQRDFEIIAGSSYFHPSIGLELLFSVTGVGQPLGDLNGVVSAGRDQINASMVGPGFSGPAELRLLLTRVSP